ncbi:MAG: FGGY-family carbohydrate kinase, partial [Clostridia bacterium]
NSLSISLGTSGVIFSASDIFVDDKQSKVHSFCHANGHFHAMGVMLSAAGSLDWWTKEVLKSSDFTAVLEEVRDTKIDNLLFLPYLMGERSPINDPNAKGVFYGLSLMHSRNNITRAILEGISFGIYDCLLTLRALGNTTSVARVIGGGARSDIWLQILSDVLGIELRTINSVDGSGLGAVILAMVGTGKFTSVNDACKAIIRDCKVFVPDNDNHQKYIAKFEKFKSLYYKLK